MRVLLVSHGYPPELVGGTEYSVQGLARNLARAGHDPVVVAGSMDTEGGRRVTHAEDTDPASGRSFPVHRIHRADSYFDHWQKHREPRARAAFRDLVAEIEPDVAHVHHWIRLSSDLVATLARERVPAVVTLHDVWATCLVTFRVRPDTRRFCEVPLAADPCLDCAAHVPPRTPWIPREQQHLMLAERRGTLQTELALARAVLAPSQAHADLVARTLGTPLEERVVPPACTLEYDAPPPPAAAAPLVVACWGHLHPLKGPGLIVSAVRALPDPSAVRLHLLGREVDPRFAERLRADAEGLDVHFHGSYEAESLDAHPAVAEAHVFASGSLAHESWGIVLDEALHLRKPVLLPDAGAFAERAAGSAWARLYPQGDEAALSALLAELAADPARVAAMRDALPDPREATCTPERHLELVLAAYSDAIDAGPPEPPAEEWFAARMQAMAVDDWDRRLGAADPVELGLEETHPSEEPPAPLAPGADEERARPETPPDAEPPGNNDPQA